MLYEVITPLDISRMPTEWLKLMLEEIARKEEEAKRASEEERRRREDSASYNFV